MNLICPYCKAKVDDTSTLVLESQIFSHALCYYKEHFATLWLTLRRQLSQEQRKVIENNAKIVPFHPRPR